MRRPVTTLTLAFLGLAAFALFMGWAFFQGTRRGDSVTLGPLWPYAVGGLAVIAALVAFFMWLAIYSARHDLD
jgi:hypothetical protein